MIHENQVPFDRFCSHISLLEIDGGDVKWEVI